ncbi:transcriptional regulator [Dietzia sp. HMSC21D01]|uniref:AraC family transcriptional regulator n=1 Tax=Dietzia cinnamea TaxID=321318 RepID=A0AAW5Q492_9ACTN|nr:MULTISPECIES: AraC family transcriptional regulator [Dietzia]PWD96597.1 AraC family transcriptional regulator [Dietzia maris]MBM7231506.1 AraC family transcriptional regulator [Dietzia cinnamea]MCT1863227.1 AraC family transcriptional regulator [Dietzia cinnamea]MCT2031288.1 AraC family transcriptional regulator [Dietzia cinnamea]MCT2032660.1 AraC family transcriptional regulator [Dietzia cinnamea]
MAFIRSAGLRGVRAVVAGLGGDADDLARRSGLPHGALDSDEMLVEDLAIALLLETAAVELQCPDLGLRVAEHQDLDMLGPVAMVVKNARTTTAALEMTSKYLFFHSRSIEITVVPDPRGEPDVVGVRFGYRDPAQLIPPQAVDLVLLFLHRAMRTVLGGDYGLLSVELPGPLNTDAAQYEALFGAPVKPSTPSAVLRVPSALLGREISGGDDVVQQLALRYLEQHVPTDRRTLTDRTRAALHQSLDAGASSLARIAGLLSMSPRSLQRGLAGEGTSFSAVRDEVRREVATRLLTTTEIPLYQIASALDLGDATTFSQYARRWWGMTAREVRHGRSWVGQSTP